MIHRPLLALTAFILIKHEKWQHRISVSISVYYLLSYRWSKHYKSNLYPRAPDEKFPEPLQSSTSFLPDPLPGLKEVAEPP